MRKFSFIVSILLGCFTAFVLLGCDSEATAAKEQAAQTLVKQGKMLIAVEKAIQNHDYVIEPHYLDTPPDYMVVIFVQKEAKKSGNSLGTAQILADLHLKTAPALVKSKSVSPLFSSKSVPPHPWQVGSKSVPPHPLLVASKSVSPHPLPAYLLVRPGWWDTGSFTEDSSTDQ